MFNSRGQLVGINTAIFTRTGASSGVGFAIPVDTVKRVVPQVRARPRLRLLRFAGLQRPLIDQLPHRPPYVSPQLVAYGRVTRPSLGLKFTSDEVCKQFKSPEGAMIQSIRPGSPAEKAGLLPLRRGLSGVLAGDIVTEINGKPVRRAKDVTNVLDAEMAAQGGGGSKPLTLVLTVSRDGKPFSVSLELAAP